MSNTVNSTVPVTFVPSSAVSSPSPSTNPSPSQCPRTYHRSRLCPFVPRPNQPCHRIYTHTEDYINRIRTFHVPTYALDGVRESLQRGDGIAFLAQSEASLQRILDIRGPDYNALSPLEQK